MVEMSLNQMRGQLRVQNTLTGICDTPHLDSTWITLGSGSQSREHLDIVLDTISEEINLRREQAYISYSLKASIL